MRQKLHAQRGKENTVMLGTKMLARANGIFFNPMLVAKNLPSISLNFQN